MDKQMIDDMDELVIREKAEAFNDILAEEWSKGYQQADRNWREKIESVIKECELTETFSSIMAKSFNLSTVKIILQDLLK